MVQCRSKVQVQRYRCRSNGAMVQRTRDAEVQRCSAGQKVQRCKCAGADEVQRCRGARVQGCKGARVQGRKVQEEVLKRYRCAVVLLVYRMC